MCGTKTCEKWRFLMRKGTKIALKPRGNQSYWYTQVLSLNKVILDIIARIGFLVFIYCWKGI